MVNVFSSTTGHATSATYITDPELRGRRIGEATRVCLIDLAFGESRIPSIVSVVHDNNTASVRLTRKLGFTPDMQYRHKETVEGPATMPDATTYVLKSPHLLHAEGIGIVDPKNPFSKGLQTFNRIAGRYTVHPVSEGTQYRNDIQKRLLP